MPLPPTHLLTYSLHYLPTLWLIGAPLTFTLLATGLVGSARLRRRATPLLAGPAHEACERLRKTLNITRRVALAACDSVAQPILVGAFRPLILLPTAALAGWTPEQLDMVLLHELAHVRRWDNLVNLLQRIVESLLFFHPAVWLLSRQVRRDREECCDAAVIRHTDRPHQYAELLVSIAAALRGGPAPSLAVASAMASHPLAGRIRRILNLEEEPMRITRRTLAATLLLPLLLAGAIFYSGARAQDPLPSNGAEQPSTVASDERSQGGSPREATTGWNPDAEQPNTPSSDKKELKSEGDEDSFTASYPIQPDTRIDLFDLARSLSGHNLKLDMVAGEWAIVLHAPKYAHNRLKYLLGDPSVPQPSSPTAEPSAAPWPAASPWNGDPASASARQNGGAKAQSEIPQLQNEIRKLESLVIKSQEELVNLEVYKELIGRSEHPGSSELEAAIAKQFDLDPTINKYKEQLFELQSAVQTKLAESKNPNSPQIKRLRATIQQTEAQVAKYRTEAERQLREKHAHIPKDAERAAELEYKIRRKSVEANLAKYEQDLAAAKTKLAQLESTASAQPAPLLDRLKQLRAAFDAQRPLFEQDPNSPVQKVRYDGANLPDIVGDHWPYLVKGISNEPGKPPIFFNWTGLGNKNYELEVPAAAHEKFFRPLFDGKLPTVGTGAPGAPNQGGAATGSGANNAQPSTMASPNSTAPVPQPSPAADPGGNASQSELRAVLAETKHRLERQLADLKKGATKAEEGGLEAEAALASTLEQKILEWEVMNKARKSLLANGPDSPIQGSAATGSKSNDFQPNSSDSPGSAAPVQEPEPFGSMVISKEQFRRFFKESTTNSQLTKFYPVPRELQHKIEIAINTEMDEILDSTLRPFTLEWRPNEDAVYVTAPTLAHRAYFRTFFANRALNELSSPPQPQLPEYQKALKEYDEARADAVQAYRELISERQASSTTPSPFPTLENQKIADRAYKLLGLELEPLTPSEQERVKKLGYAGGLKVAHLTGETRGAHGNLQVGHLLVGLHVWPITNFASIDEILRRPDLSELAPLKYYAVRKIDPNRDASDDELTTGRLSIPEAALLSRDLETADRKHAEIAAVRVPSDSTQVIVMQAPTSQKTSLFGGTVTTAYLKVKFDRLPGSFSGPPATFTNANVPLTPQEIELQAINCLTMVKSPPVLKAALKSFTPQDAQEMWQEQAAERLKNRLSAVFPGDGEILELKLEGGDAKEDSILLQAIIDAFIAEMNRPPQSPADPNAAGKSNENAADALNPFANTVLSSSPAEVDGPPTATFLYDGKTFDQWRDLWKLELNPERRTEAINAMAAFSRAGRGDEALNAILDVAAEYDFSTIDPNDPAGRLKERIIKLFTDYASSGAYQDPWLPIVMERMKSDADKWRPMVEILLYRCMPPHRTQYSGSSPIMSAANVELLKKAVGDERLSAKVLFLTTLNNVAAHDPDVIRMTKEALQSDDTESSLNLLGGIGFANVDELPEQLEFLFAAEPATRQAAREILSRSVGPKGRDAVADKLLAILNDANQSARHADAIRALAMFSKTKGPTPYGYGLSKEKKREVFESLRRVAQTGSTELFIPAVVASELMYDAPELARSLLMKTLSDERKELLEESTQQLADEKELLLKGTALGEQPGGGFF